MMENIPDDPIISCIERTGYPPWMQADEEIPDDPWGYANDEWPDEENENEEGDRE